MCGLNSDFAVEIKSNCFCYMLQELAEEHWSQILISLMYEKLLIRFINEWEFYKPDQLWL